MFPEEQGMGDTEHIHQRFWYPYSFYFSKTKLKIKEKFKRLFLLSIALKL